ncbi:MAG: hypothetical protein KatS3mg051_0866 [Anaerolineae bacterium]|nr:MAG: hypothetical protein KatS3mg051_0866 [Anaerolineae bacterium]
MRFAGFDTNAVVRYTIRNTDIAPAYITGFSINWNTFGRTLPPIFLDFVAVGGPNAFDPAAVKIWDSAATSTTPPTVGVSGGPGWLVDAVISPRAAGGRVARLRRRGRAARSGRLQQL